MLSICVTVKNRSRIVADGRPLALFPRCVESISRSAGNIPCELVVTDWKSDDWPLCQWLESAAAPVPCRIVTMEGNFSRGRGRNVAAAAARGSAFFFLDADCLISPELLSRAMEHVAAGRAYFPVVYSYEDPEETCGWWRREGMGTCILSRELFLRSGGWPEYETWGKEDDDYFARLKAIAEVARDEAPGYFHQWHPNDVEWKDQFAEQSLETQQFNAKAKQASEDIASVVPDGATIVLVDEAQFGSRTLATALAGRTILPFIEHDGVYWGLPADDEHAINELRRMRTMGATVLAFAWPAFWWLDHYAAFVKYIELNLSRVLENDRVRVFVWR